MRKLLLGLFLGLLAVVHSTPVTTVTQVPVNHEDDVFREAMTDGFLVLTTERAKTQTTTEASKQTESTASADNGSRDSPLTTESPKRNATVPASQQPESEETEGSAEGVTDSFWYGGSTTTTFIQEASDASESTTTTSTQEASDATESTTTTSTQEASDASESTTKTSMQEASDATESTTSEHPTKQPAQSTTVKASQQPVSDFMSDGSALGESEDMYSTFSWLGSSGDDKSILPATVDSLGSEWGSGIMDEPTISKTRGGGLLNMAKPETVVENPAKVVEEQDPEQHKGHTTPGWIIIVGFIVGVAALVMLCLAIATRDKWNGPSQASTTKTETNPSNQQRGLEMETFLPREEPRENGKAAEYTVIPLDELSESYS